MHNDYDIILTNLYFYVNIVFCMEIYHFR